MAIVFSEGSGVANSVFGKSQEPIKMFVEKKAEAWEAESALPALFDMNPSKNFGEKITGMTSLNGMQPVEEGGAYPNDEMEEGYSKTLVHTTFKDQFAITQEMVEDAKLMDFKKKPAAFIAGAYRTRERFGASILGGGMYGTTVTFGGKTFSTAGADGKAMFATDHPNKVNGATQSNKYTNAFSVDALSYAESDMQNRTDDNGNILALAPDTIVIPNSAVLKKEVFAAIGADKDPATANNGFNYQFGRWNVIVWAYLNALVQGSDLPWILMDSKYNMESGGLVWFDRVKLRMRSVIDESNDNNVWKGYARWSAGCADYRCLSVGGMSAGTTLAG